MAWAKTDQAKPVKVIAGTVPGSSGFRNVEDRRDLEVIKTFPGPVAADEKTKLGPQSSFVDVGA